MKFSHLLCVLVSVVQIVQMFHTLENSRSFYIKPACRILLSHRTSELVPYRETYQEKILNLFYQTKMRWNYKTVYKVQWQAKSRCCPGYAEFSDLFLENLCKPLCNPPCGENGVCVIPNICSCSEGYQQRKSNILSVLEPDTEDVCVPVCSRNCHHGRCTAPEVCTCDDGYSLSADGITCEPVCNEIICETGSHCSAPNYCACSPGYLTDIFQTNVRDRGWPPSSISETCQPICDQDCVKGECTAPNICTCHNGYELDSDDPFNCKPKCDHGCDYGMCTAPNTCTCNNGYSLKKEGVCEPICSKTCEMGICVAPESCKCLDGYGFFENSTNICEPICERVCQNGKCSAPGVCQCNEGFRLSRDESAMHICEPYCKDSCEPYGVCTAPNVCTCFDGYRLTNKTREETTNAPDAFGYFADFSVCEPVCTSDCVNGDCTAPNRCTCKLGYRATDRANVCEPICHEACDRINATCRAPNVCVCDDGYRTIHHDNDTMPYECAPICNFDCGNGTCTAPDHCTCFSGYQASEAGDCTPVCATCNNGTCVAPEVCLCDDGYFLKQSWDIMIPGYVESEPVLDDQPRNQSTCVPRCEYCDNGECVAPDECRCHNGFRPIEGVCVEACKNGCDTHGECVDERGECECSYGWTGPRCNRPTLCIVILNDDEANRTESFTIVEEQNATIDHVLVNNPACPECLNKLNNETLCLYINGTENATQIGCLMDIECQQLSSQYKGQKEIVTVIGVVGALGALLLTTVAIYVLLWKRRNKQTGVNNEQSTLTEELIDESSRN